MNYLDLFIVVGLGASIILSMVRGGIYEALSAAGWVLGVYVSAAFAGKLVMPYLGGIENQEVRIWVAHVILFVLVVFLCSLVAVGLRRLSRNLGLGPADRLLGAIAGALKGILVLLLLGLVAQLTPLPQTDLWANSRLQPYVANGLQIAQDWLPNQVATYMKSLQDKAKADTPKPPSNLQEQELTAPASSTPVPISSPKPKSQPASHKQPDKQKKSASSPSSSSR